MHILVPPDECNGKLVDQETMVVGDQFSAENANDNSPAMSPGLRQKFAMIQRTKQEGSRPSLSAAEREHLRCQEQKLALEAALAAETEMARWQTGIAELEALLARDDDNGVGLIEDGQQWNCSHPALAQRDDRPLVVEFPTLPPIVPPGGVSSSDAASSNSKYAA